MITIATFSKPEEAHLLRTRLEAGEVRAFVQDENLVQMDWLYSNAIGGVRVQVFEEDWEAALEILNEAPGEVFADEGDGALIPSRPLCPACSSAATSPDERPRRWSFLSILFLSVPLPVGRGRWRCSACGTAWREG